jgi:hypothetical protein
MLTPAKKGVNFDIAKTLEDSGKTLVRNRHSEKQLSLTARNGSNHLPAHSDSLQSTSIKANRSTDHLLLASNSVTCLAAP